jgi:hypothetical protein
MYRSTYINTYIHTHIHTYRSYGSYGSYIHKYIHTYIHTYTHTHTYIHISQVTQTWLCRAGAFAYTHTHIHTYTPSRRLESNKISTLDENIFDPQPMSTQITVIGNLLTCCPRSLIVRKNDVCRSKERPNGLPPCVTVCCII